MKSFLSLMVLGFSSAVLAAAAPETLTLHDLVNRPERLPEEVTMTKDVDFGAGGLKKGQKVRVMQFTGQEIGVDAGVGDLLMAVTPEECDFLEAANAAWSKLSPEQKALDVQTVLNDASLWPAKVRCTSGFTLDKTAKNLPPNMEYELVSVDRAGVTLWATEDKAKLNATIDQTDLVRRARELVAIDPAKRPGRIPAALKGAMVDSTGKPAEVDVDGANVFALYYSASWCGPCRQFTPGFIEYITGIQAANPKLVVVLISNDEKDADMLKYMTEDKMPWMAVPMAKMNETPVLLGYAKGGIPQLTIVDKYGKVLADSFNGRQYVGPKVAMAGLDKLIKAGATK